MTKINNYDDLILEKRRLSQTLLIQKMEINAEIHSLKQKFAPIINLVSLFGGGAAEGTTSVATTGKSLLKLGANAGIDLLVGPRLAKAGLFAKLAIPFVLRRISSTVLNRFTRKKDSSHLTSPAPASR